MAALRPAGRGGAGGAASARDSPMVDACHQLAALFAEHPDRRAVFLAQDGIVAIIELLEERSHKARPLPAAAARAPPSLPPFHTVPAKWKSHKGCVEICGMCRRSR